MKGLGQVRFPVPLRLLAGANSITMAMPKSGEENMRRTWIVAVAAWALSAGGAPAGEPLVEQVRVAIEKGIRFLRNEERGRGNWEHTIGATGKPGGYSCLAVLALLNSGVKADDPIIQRALKYLRNLEPEYTYV